MSFEVGDIVYDLRFGEGVVIEYYLSPSYQIGVRFLGSRNTETYTDDGYCRIRHKTPMLYHSKPYITKSEPVKPEPIEYWVNIYPEGAISQGYTNKAKAVYNCAITGKTVHMREVEE